MLYNYYILFFLGAGMLLSVYTGKLTTPAALLGGLVGLLIYQGAGFTGITMLALFFVLATIATGLGSNKKRAMGLRDENKGRRNAGQVIANAGVAATLGAIGWYVPALANTIQLLVAGSIAAATADTLSSELGTLLGRKFYNVVTFQKDQPGLDGVISIEGTLIGVAGAAVIALVYSLGHGYHIASLYIILAGITGNFVDSLLGATLERRLLLGNNTVNFLNTLAGALTCLLFLKA